MKKYLFCLLLFFAFATLVLIFKLIPQAKKTEIFLEQGSSLPAPYHLACPFAGAPYLSDRSQVEKKIKASALIVSHHLLAKDLINQAMEFTTQDHLTVVLIGPNHFDLGSEEIQISINDWQTKFGRLNSQKHLTYQLAEHQLAAVNPQNFNTEHSVCSLVSFIRKQFPQAQLVPLILKSTTSLVQSQVLGQFLAQNCADCLLIASLDFSHEVPLSQSKINDQKSQEILENLAEDQLNQVTCDSLPVLQVLFAYLQEKNIKQGKIINQSNSYQISGQNPESVTSYLTFIYF